MIAIQYNMYLIILTSIFVIFGLNAIAPLHTQYYYITIGMTGQQTLRRTTNRNYQQTLHKLTIDKACYENIVMNVDNNLCKKIGNYNNQRLYPIYMGPHYVYTIDHPEQQPTAIPLRSNLIQVLESTWQSQDRNYTSSQIQSVQSGSEDSLYSEQQRKTDIVIQSNRICERSGCERSGCERSGCERSGCERSGCERSGCERSGCERSGCERSGKYKKYSIQFKKKVVQEVNQIMQKNREKNKKASYYIHKKAKQYGIAPKNIYRWMECDELTLKQSGRKARFPQLQKKLLLHMMNNPWKKRRQLLIQAKQIMEEMGEEYDDFCFSKGWFERFKKRHRIGKLSKFCAQVCKDMSVCKNEQGEGSVEEDYQKQAMNLEMQQLGVGEIDFDFH